MSPRSGGETDKFGNRYESGWTVRHLLYVLHGRGSSITVEPTGTAGDGVEFVYVNVDGVEEAHQVKRQMFGANHWTVRSLHSLGIWTAARRHVELGRQFHFVSILPAASLQDLTNRARQAPDLQEFIGSWLTSEPITKAFNELCAADVYGSPDTAWHALRGIWIEWHDERDIHNVNAVLSGLLLSGASEDLAVVGLGDLVLHNLGTPLTQSVMGAQLLHYGLTLAGAIRNNQLAASIDGPTQRWLASVERELLRTPIVRKETRQLRETILNPDQPQLTLVSGTAGAGKSAVLAEALRQLTSEEVPVLAFRLDRLEEFDTTTELGNRLGLQTSPVAALASRAGTRTCVLLVDQLDAISLASGRMPNNFDAIADLVGEARAFPNLRVVLACRQFDIENDYRIRTLREATGGTTIAIAKLTDTEVDTAVDGMGLRSETMSRSQREVLRLPLHLVLLASVSSDADALSFETTAHLFDAFWLRKRRLVESRKAGIRFNEVIVAVATAISDNQRLSVSDALLDQTDLALDADVLVSEHILTRDGNKIAFFHESFFDYAFARLWAMQRETLVSFLTTHEQELFRRAQVRQVLHHLRQRDPDRYVHELQATLLDPRVRFHIKDVMLRLLGDLPDPTSAELDVVLAYGGAGGEVAARCWLAVRTGPWFIRMDADGRIAEWLSSNNDVEAQQALEMLTAGVRTAADRVTEVLSNFAGSPMYGSWLRRIVRFAQPHTSRPFFELVLAGIRAGLFVAHDSDLWLFAHTLAETQPFWAIDLIATYLTERPGALSPDDSGTIPLLTTSEYEAAELIQTAAKAEPGRFVEVILPIMLEITAATMSDQGSSGFPSDPHFSYADKDLAADSELDDTLYNAMLEAIAVVVRQDPISARTMLERLAAMESASAQNLLYTGLVAGGPAHASWAAVLLLQGTPRLLAGDLWDDTKATRQLLSAITPHLNNDEHRAVEACIRDLRLPAEERAAGSHAFSLLSALDENRLTEAGRRRLGEYRRKFGVEKFEAPRGMSAGSLLSPIPSHAVSHMTDRNWLQAMTRYDVDTHDWDTFTGGARELATELLKETKANPVRFARLALQLPTDSNSEYATSILRGLGEQSVAPDDQEVVFDCVRHLAKPGQSGQDRWLGWALRLYLNTTPLDLVELLVARLLSAKDPQSDNSFHSSNVRRPGDRLHQAGMNSARGSLAESLGNLIARDVDGSRTALVTPYLQRIVADPVTSVRSQVAHLVAAVLRFDRPASVEAFEPLIASDDELLTSDYVIKLMMYIGNGGRVDLVLPVIVRMLAAADPGVRERGGLMAVHAGLQWHDPGPLSVILAGTDTPSRVGAARACAHSLAASRDTAIASSALLSFFDDPDPLVRKAAAELAGAMREHALRPIASVIRGLIESAAYEPATPQLFITIQRAPDRVDDLALASAQRFVDRFGAAAGDLSTHAAADARYVCELVTRGLAQARDADHRSALLDVIDNLMLNGAYGVDEAVEIAAR